MFVVEQRVPPEVELDDDDAVSVHAVAYGPDGTPMGRLKNMAVTVNGSLPDRPDQASGLF